MSEKFMIEKKYLKFEQGYLLDGNEVVGLPTRVAVQINRLELMIQQDKYLKSQPKACYIPMPTLATFKKKSCLHTETPKVEEPETPTIDARVAESLAFMEEVDKVKDVRELNELLAKFQDLFEWIATDKFVEGDWTEPLDLPEVGNPLELTKERVIEALTEMVEHPAVHYEAGDHDGDR